MAHLLLRLMSENTYQQDTTYRFNSQGGTIGRSEACQWTIVDPERIISKYHLSVSYQNGQFIITDTSTNGVSINAIGNLLGNGNQHTIELNDKLIIGEYQIIAEELNTDPSISETSSPALMADNMSGIDEDILDLVMASEQPLSENSNSIDPLDLLSEQPAGKPELRDDDFGLQEILDTPSPILAEDLANIAPTNSGESSIPDDWGLTGFMKSIKEPQLDKDFQQSIEPQPDTEFQSDTPDKSVFVAAESSAPPIHDDIVAKAVAENISPELPIQSQADSVNPVTATSSDKDNAQDDFLALLYKNMGLPKEYFDTLDKKAFAEDLSAILFSTTKGLMSLLNGRSIFKQEARLSLTSIQPKSNNPLKFTRDPTDTFEILLIRKKPGYLTAKESYDEAIYDLELHQMAFLSGLQATLTGVLNQLEPEAIESLAKESERNFLGLNTRSLSWKMYKEKQQALSLNVKQNLNEVLNNFFADAYQAQINRMKNKS